jgi:hypothetical protein
MQVYNNGTTVIYEEGTIVQLVKNGKTTTFRNKSFEHANATVDAIRKCAENPTMTFRDLVRLWWTDYAQHALVENSRTTYRSVIDRHILPFFADLHVGRITEDTLVRFIGEGLAQGHTNRAITAWFLKLQAILEKARKWGLIDDNPTMAIDALLLGGRPDGLADVA